MERWRCFVAVPVPDGLRAALAAAVDAWREEPDGGALRWTHPDSWHLTLAFLGWVPSDVVPSLLAAVARAARDGEPARLAAGGLGVFPSPRRARVLWYGVADPDGLAARLADAVRSELLPFVPSLADEKPFRAHVTLARARDERGADLSNWLVRHAAPAGVVPMERVILYRSHLGGGGPARYEPLGSVAIGLWEVEASVHG